MLNVTASVSLREMAVRFGCLEAEQLAREIINKCVRSHTRTHTHTRIITHTCTHTHARAHTHTSGYDTVSLSQYSYRGKMDSEFSREQRESMDLTKPIYSAAGLYTACRLDEESHLSC